MNEEIKPKAKFLLFPVDYKSIYPTLTAEYNTIYSYSPLKVGYAPNEATVDYVGQKRIRPLTPNLKEKSLLTSPLKSQSDFSPIKDNNSSSAFKNLNLAFESCKK